MLQDPKAIRHFQKLADAIAELWHRGRRYDELRLYVDGYLAALRYTDALDAYWVNRLEAEVIRYLYDPSNYQQVQTEVEPGFAE